MRPVSHFVCLLLLVSVISGCHKSSTPVAETPARPAVAAPSPAPIHQPTAAEIDTAVAANIGEPAELRETISALQQAVQRHDAAAVAALVNYPITVDPRTPSALRIRTPQEFIAAYDRIVTPHLADIITGQQYDKLFVNYQGAMFGDGELWLSGSCRDEDCRQTDIKIRTIQNTDGKAK